MVSFLADKLILVLDDLDYCRKRYKEVARASEELPKEGRDALEIHLEKLRAICEKLGLPAADDRRAAISRRLLGMCDGCSHGQLADSLGELLDTVRYELCGKHFSFIPDSKVEFFEQHDLFGESVSAAFPSAQPEIKDAGNCLAADLHTAAVFHFLRAAEHGLRALARHLRVKLGTAIEYATWEEVIRSIDRKLTVLRTKPKGRKKEEALQFYRQTLSECEMLKDVWRNPVSHARRRYNEVEALAVYSRVHDFMQRLSERVKEGK